MPSQVEESWSVLLCCSCSWLWLCLLTRSGAPLCWVPTDAPECWDADGGSSSPAQAPH